MSEVRWFEAKLVSLAGMTPKMEAQERIVTGMVRHIRGDEFTSLGVAQRYYEYGDPKPDGVDVHIGAYQWLYERQLRRPTTQDCD